VRSNPRALQIQSLGRYEDAITQYTQALKIERQEPDGFVLILHLPDLQSCVCLIEAADEFRQRFSRRLLPDSVPLTHERRCLLLADCNVRLAIVNKTVLDSGINRRSADRCPIPINRGVAFLVRRRASLSVGLIGAAASR
jgi:hypothetical protein